MVNGLFKSQFETRFLNWNFRNFWNGSVLVFIQLLPLILISFWALEILPSPIPMLGAMHGETSAGTRGRLSLDVRLFVENKTSDIGQAKNTHRINQQYIYCMSPEVKLQLFHLDNDMEEYFGGIDKRIPQMPPDTFGFSPVLYFFWYITQLVHPFIQVVELKEADDCK